MINAYEAAERSIKSGVLVMKEELDAIDKAIHQRCDEGEMSLIWYKELEPKVVKHLKELGYRVETPQFEKGSVISW